MAGHQGDDPLGQVALAAEPFQGRHDAVICRPRSPHGCRFSLLVATAGRGEPLAPDAGTAAFGFPSRYCPAGGLIAPPAEGWGVLSAPTCRSVAAAEGTLLTACAPVSSPGW